MLAAADKTALATCAAPNVHGSTCDIQCTDATYGPVSSSQSSSTFTCDKGQWIPPAKQLQCARTCSSTSYCTGMYERIPNLDPATTCVPGVSDAGNCMSACVCISNDCGELPV